MWHRGRVTAVSEHDVECRTPDGRYLVVRGRLWRATNPHLPSRQSALVTSLMTRAGSCAASAARKIAPRRERVDAAKVALGERGPVWWD